MHTPLSRVRGRGLSAIASSVVVLGTLAILGLALEARSQTTQPAVPASSKLLFQMTDVELGQYIRGLRETVSTAPERAEHVAMRSWWQPFRLEAPMFSHRETDCVTFVEHALAIALADSWESYCRLTARLRFANGAIPLAPGDFTIDGYRLKPRDPSKEVETLRNRNTFIIAEWIRNNAWCLEDITKNLGSGPIKPWIPLHHIIRPKAFFARQGLVVDRSDEKVIDAFIPREAVRDILPELKSGDVVLVIVGPWEDRDCDHMGILIERTPWDTVDRDGPPSVMHSTEPRVRRDSLMGMLRRFPRIQGFKFLRLRPEAEANAIVEDAAMTARITVPAAGSTAP